MALSNQYIKGCAGKKQHKTLLSAEVYLEEKHYMTEARIYQCDSCGYYHIGNPPKSKKKINYKTKLTRKHDDEQRKKPKIRKFKY